MREEFRFCPFCGAGAVASTAVEPARERRVVSILFCDVAGFTAASADADPEDVRARMDAYYGLLRPVIEAFDGTVQKFIGDAVMAVFGVPVVHEDDPERAVRAGLAILDAVDDQNAANPGLDLAVRIGVNTGEAVADIDVQSGSGEAIALGDTVNTAARIQVAAPISGVAVGEATFRATERVFDYEPLEPVVAKGKAEPLEIWRAVAPRARLGSDVIRTLTTPLVGRRQELAALTDALEESVRERAVRLVTVVAEPGTGKSRLVAELGRFVDAMPILVVWRQGRCLPFGDGITFWALGEIVKAHAGIYDSDSVEAATAKLEQALPEGDDHGWLRSRLLPLLGVQGGEQGSQQELFLACRRFLEEIAERNPLAIVVEDIHWADEAMLAFLEYLVGSARDVPLLVVCTARPELFHRQPGWGSGLPNAEMLAVGPLSDEETARLVSILLDRTVLPAATQRLLLERAGGNPLHAEEFVRMLRDRGLVDEQGRLAADGEIIVPDSIHALIAARLDTLPADRKRLLQDAAVIGKVFWAGAAATMGERQPAAVAEALGELARRELIRPAAHSSMEGETEYGFWHALVRDVAYSQIPRGQRATRHLSAVDWIEGKAGERIEDVAEVLAYHTAEALILARAMRNPELEAEVTPAAARYALLAGERALDLDVVRAGELLERARTLTPDDDPASTRVQLRWAEAVEDSGRLEEAGRLLESVAAELEAKGDALNAGRAWSRLGFIWRRLGRSDFLSLHERAVALLEPTPGPELVAALAEYVDGLYVSDSPAGWEEGVALADRARELAAEMGLPEPGWAVGARGGCRCRAGDPGGLSDLRRAIELLRATGDRRVVFVMHNHAYQTSRSDGTAAALAGLDQTLELASARGVEAMVRFSRGVRVLQLIDSGRLTDALEEIDALLPLAREGGDRIMEGNLVGFQLSAVLERGAESAASLSELVEAVEACGPRAWPGTRLMAALVRGDAAAIAAALDDISRELEVTSELEIASPSALRLLAALGEAGLARRLCAEVAAIGAFSAFAVDQHVAVLARALAAELDRAYGEAVGFYADAAAGWKAFTNVLEHAHALLGWGRCLAALGDPEAEQPLRDARILFERMGARPAIAECDALLSGTAPLSRTVSMERLSGTAERFGAGHGRHVQTPDAPSR